MLTELQPQLKKLMLAQNAEPCDQLTPEVVKTDI